MGRKKQDLLTRFWSKVRKGEPDECWVWVGGSAHGYGRFGFENKTYGAHRLAYQFAKGRIPTGLDVLHNCDNPPCCNPNHLRVGTHLENMHERDNKGRRLAARGEKSGASKLTTKDIIEIRNLYDNFNKSTRTLAEKYGVSQVAIYYIVARKTWKHVA